MRDRLKELLNNSYAPYSNFRVSAVVVMKDGTSFNGVNVENAAYGSSICAERSAILAAISNGYKKNDFDKLYVMCDSPKISSSCFICRQMINEFFDKEAEIVFYSNDGEKETYLVKDLCPYPFGSSDLK